MTKDGNLTVDATGLSCPMPLLKTKLAMSDMAVGEAVLVLTTDQGSLSDIPKFVARAGHELVSVSDQTTPYRLLIRKRC